MAITIRHVKNWPKHKELTKHIENYWSTVTTTWDSPQSYWFVVFDKGKWVGYGGMRVHDIESCYTGPTFIKPEYRGKGLQRQLIKKRLRLAKKLGFTKVVSCTEIANINSSNNLIKCGFMLRPDWFKDAPTSNNLLFWTIDL